MGDLPLQVLIFSLQLFEKGGLLVPVSHQVPAQLLQLSQAVGIGLPLGVQRGQAGLNPGRLPVDVLRLSLEAAAVLRPAPGLLPQGGGRALQRLNPLLGPAGVLFRAALPLDEGL